MVDPPVAPEVQLYLFRADDAVLITRHLADEMVERLEQEVDVVQRSVVIAVCLLADEESLGDIHRCLDDREKFSSMGCDHAGEGPVPALKAHVVHDPGFLTKEPYMMLRTASNQLHGRLVPVLVQVLYEDDLHGVTTRSVPGIVGAAVSVGT